MTNQGKLVVITGIDGSGKSSVVSGLESDGFRVAHWRRLKNIKLKNQLNFTNPAEEIQHLDDDERLDFIRDYLDSEWNELIYPELLDGNDLVSDSYFVKFYCKESIYKRLDLKRLGSVTKLSGRELFIFIDTPPALALERKGGVVSPYECFHSSGDFVEFQSELRSKLIDFMVIYKHEVIDGRMSKSRVYGRVRQILYENNIHPSL